MFRMLLLRFQDVIDQLDNVDDLDVLEKAKTNRALAHALEMSRPRNWHGSGLSPEQILPLARESAIPVMWLPSAPILQTLVEVQPEDRVEVLFAYEAGILDDCHVLLKECDDPWIADERALVVRAVATYKAGFHEAAMARAVAVGEPRAHWASESRVRVFGSEQERNDWEKQRRANKYPAARLELAAVNPGTKLTRIQVLRHALIGPIERFFTPFHREAGDQIPSTVSRHATVHQPTVEHLSKQNALLALMLDVSILREQQVWAEQVRMDDEFYVES